MKMTWLWLGSAIMLLLFPRVASKPCHASDVFDTLEDGSYDASTLDLHHCRKLDLRYCNLGNEAAAAIGEALKTNTALHHLNFGFGNKVLLNGVRALSEGLKVNTALESLHLGGNMFYGAGGEELALALHSHKALKSLRLGGNVLGFAGNKAMATLLKVNTVLEELVLIDNSIGDAVAKLLADALVVNRSLKKLDLRRNVFGSDGAAALEAALKGDADGVGGNSVLTHLHVNKNAKVTAEQRRSIFTLTEANKARERRDRFNKESRSAEL